MESISVWEILKYCVCRRLLHFHVLQTYFGCYYTMSEGLCCHINLLYCVYRKAAVINLALAVFTGRCDSYEKWHLNVISSPSIHHPEGPAGAVAVDGEASMRRMCANAPSAGRRIYIKSIQQYLSLKLITCYGNRSELKLYVRSYNIRKFLFKCFIWCRRKKRVNPPQCNCLFMTSEMILYI